MTPLSKEEKKAYRRAKSGIRKTLQACVDGYVGLGKWIAEVLRGELHREEYGSFELFCRANLPFGARHAYRLAEASVLPIANNERQARALLGLAEEEATAVVQAAKMFEGRVTSGTIKSARERIEEATAHITDPEERLRAILDLLQQHEDAAAGLAAPDKPPRMKPDRKAGILAVTRKIGGFLGWCRQQHAGLVDVADDCDQVVTSLLALVDRYEELVKSSAELAA